MRYIIKLLNTFVQTHIHIDRFFISVFTVNVKQPHQGLCTNNDFSTFSHDLLYKIPAYKVDLSKAVLFILNVLVKH